MEQCATSRDTGTCQHSRNARSTLALQGVGQITTTHKCNNSACHGESPVVAGRSSHRAPCMHLQQQTMNAFARHNSIQHELANAHPQQGSWNCHTHQPAPASNHTTSPPAMLLRKLTPTASCALTVSCCHPTTPSSCAQGASVAQHTQARPPAHAHDAPAHSHSALRCSGCCRWGSKASSGDY